ncbi:MAG: hypothetical protein K9N07_11710 [Candidatus Cloacimonetes bacterium]|nr:hypothetical protein [Candidatus Cloacimonadota bacterium]
MKNKIKYGFIFILIAGYVILLYKLTELKNENKALVTKYISLHSRFYEHDEKASLLNPVEYRYKNIELGLVDSVESSYQLVSIIGEEGCPTCIITEIHDLNKLHNKFPSQVKVFHVGEREQFLEKFGIKFDYTKIDSIESILPQLPKYNLPMSLVINPRKVIVDLHRAESGLEIKSNLFYERIAELLSERK